MRLHANYEGANGRTLIEMIREYVEMSQALQRNPLLGIQKIAARYDIDLFAFEGSAGASQRPLALPTNWIKPVMKGRLTAYDRCPHLVADDAAIYAIVPLAPDRRFPRSLLFCALVEVWRSARNTLVSAALVDGRNPFNASQATFLVSIDRSGNRHLRCMVRDRRPVLSGEPRG